MPDRIDPPSVDAALAGARLGPVVWAAEVGSTNDLVAMRARDGAPEGLVIGADFQTAGRGRRGRTWVSDRDASLLFSVLLRPSRSGPALGLLPIAVAVGVAEGLGRIGIETGLVWPNDVTAAGRKLAGVLCETASRGGAVAWTVAGVGINVAATPRVEGPRRQPTSVAEAAGAPRGRQDVLIAVLGGIDAAYGAWSAGDDRRIVTAFAARDALAGRSVRVAVGDREVTGTAEGIGADGRLRVRDAGGSVTAAGSGEVTGVDALGA